MIRGAVQFDARGQNSTQRIRQQRPRRIENREMIKSGGIRRRRRTAGTFPGVERNVMMISARREKHRVRPVARGDFKTEDVAIKLQRAVDLRNLEVYVANSNLRMYGRAGRFLVHYHL